MFQRVRLTLPLALFVALPAFGITRLSHTVSPTFEAIDLDLDPSKADYSGTVRIELHASAAASDFALHARGMEIKRLELRSKDTVLTARQESREDDILAILPTDPLPVGDYTLTLDFSRKFDTQATGLYRAEYEGHAYAFTDFEPADARQAFPCFDEPDFKIPFQVTLVIPSELDGVTNAPVESEQTNGKAKTIVFKRTPPLSTYLIAVAVGPFDEVPLPGPSAPTRIIAAKGKGGMAKDAVRLIPEGLAALERYFGRKYPFEKLDFLALPEFPGGAMENAGAITFTDSILLLDPADTGPDELSDLLIVTTHELAHMWFGDLVTMQWWDDLWLNEAFAEWLSNKLVNEIHPEYRTELMALDWIQSTMVTDARPSSPPIRRKIDDPKQAFQEYSLTYGKGMAVIGMFEQWMGPEVFRKGVLDYLAAHEWKNATVTDLLDALGRSSGRDVGGAMRTFLDQGGLPLVSVEPLPDGSLKIRQQRYAKAGIQLPDQLWKIPVILRTFDGKELHETPLLLDGPEMTSPPQAGGQLVWVLPNAGGWGYYRWSVPPAMLEALCKDAASRLSLREQVALLGNLSALLGAGRLPGDVYLRVLRSTLLQGATEIVDTTTGKMIAVHDAFVTPDLEEAYARFLRSSLRPALDRIGLSPAPGEEPAVTMLRPRLWSVLADWGQDTKLLEQAERMAQDILDGKGSVDPSLIDTVVTLSAIRGDKALFEKYRNRFETTKVPSERGRYLRALGYFKHPDLQAEALAYSLKGPLKSNEVTTAAIFISRNEAARDYMLDWLVKNYADLVKRIPPDSVVGLVYFGAGCSGERLDKATQFFSDPSHQVPGTTDRMTKVTEQVHDCLTLRDREGKAVAAFLQQADGVAGN